MKYVRGAIAVGRLSIPTRNQEQTNDSCDLFVHAIHACDPVEVMHACLRFNFQY